MKNKPVPQPTNVSAYFFQHLLPSTVAPQSPSSPLTDERSDNINYRKAMRRLVAAVLEEFYTPSEVTALLQRCAEEERLNSETLENLLETSWKRVEEVIARNKQRRRIVEEELSPAMENVNMYKFWTPDMVTVRYDFPKQEGFALSTCERENGSHMATVDGTPVKNTDKALPETDSLKELGEELSSSPPRPPASVPLPPVISKGAATTTLPGKHRAAAWKKTDKELLNPSKRPNSLRQLFAPILQQRHEFPKSLTLLLNAVQRMQTEGFPKIEALIEKGYFDLPLHRSFWYISSFITRYLAKESRGEDPERAFVDVCKPAAIKLKEARESLWKMGDCSSLASSAHKGVAEVIYGKLLAELRERKHIHEECNNSLQAITDAAALQLEEMEKGLQECDEESRRVLKEFEKSAHMYVEGLAAKVQRAKDVRDEINFEYQRDHDRLEASLQSKLYRIKKSEELQEKLARRIRETTKEWYTEQLNYERLMQEVIRENMTLRQLEVNHNQLEEVLEEHMPSAAMEKRLQWVIESLHHSEELRAQLTAQCRQHLSRLKTDEYYRRCRVAVFATENALCWSRCLNDLSLLYETHHDALVARCNTSMQLRYLLTHEKDSVIEDLQQLRRELCILDSKWSTLTAVLEELDLPVPLLTQYEQDEACKEFRRVMCQLGATRLIQAGFARLTSTEQCSPFLPQGND